MPEKEEDLTRRKFIGIGVRVAAVGAVGGALGVLGSRKSDAHGLWQIDPYKCTQCGRCATECVLTPSASKCVHNYAMCGYCDLCTGYLDAQPASLDTGAENQICPTGAIERKFIEEPYFEYHIDEKLCIGCARCVKGCTAFGNGSLFMQIRHDRCANCNECRIARACPSNAISRVGMSKPYNIKTTAEEK